MILRFTKMHGLGNDFIVIDARSQDLVLGSDDIRMMADRHFGIGCDQLLVLEQPTQVDSNIRYRIYNADGGEVEQCGNGARCVARYLSEADMADVKVIRAQTVNGIIELVNVENNLVRVDMGVPTFEPESLPMLAEEKTDVYQLQLEKQRVDFRAVSIGNPHAVIQVDAVDLAPVTQWGAIIENHPMFPQRVNVGFMQVLATDEIYLRVFERGVGETLACGTGACAAAVSGINGGLLQSPVTVKLPAGELRIEWQGEGYPVLMTGPATRVFEGEINL